MSQIHEVIQRAFEFERGGEKVRIYCLPFVAPNNVRGLEGFEGITFTHQGVVEALMSELEKTQIHTHPELSQLPTSF